jgi:hypothetical protein
VLCIISPSPFSHTHLFRCFRYFRYLRHSVIPFMFRSVYVPSCQLSYLSLSITIRIRPYLARILLCSYCSQRLYILISHTGFTLYRMVRFTEPIQCTGRSEFTGPREPANTIPYPDIHISVHTNRRTVSWTSPRDPIPASTTPNKMPVKSFGAGYYAG